MRNAERLRFVGHVGWAVLETAEDVGALLPPGVVAAEANRVLVKAYRLRRASASVLPGTARAPMHQYCQVCVSVVAGPGSASPLADGKHFNLVMWNDQPSSFEANIEAGNRKRLAPIEVSWSFPETERDVLGHVDPRFEAVVAGPHGLVLRLTLTKSDDRPALPAPPYTGVISPQRTLTSSGWVHGAVLTCIEDLRHEELFGARADLAVGSGVEPFEPEALAVLAGARPLAAGLRWISWELPADPHVVLEPAAVAP